MSISTGHVVPLSCTVCIDNHSRYCSRVCIMSLMSHIRVQYLTDHIIKLNTVEMWSLRPWIEVDSTLSDNTKWQSLCRTPLKIKSAWGMQWAVAWRRKTFVAEFSKYKFGGQLRPTNMVARRSFRAIPGNRANGVVKACESLYFYC